jgi:hypothetical protein
MFCGFRCLAGFLGGARGGRRATERETNGEARTQSLSALDRDAAAMQINHHLHKI